MWLHLSGFTLSACPHVHSLYWLLLSLLHVKGEAKALGRLKGSLKKKRKNLGRGGGGAGGGHKDTAEIPSPLHPLEGNGDTWHSASLPFVLSSSKQPMQCSSSVASQIATQHTHAPPRVTFNTWNTRNAGFCSREIVLRLTGYRKKCFNIFQNKLFFNI